MTGEELYSWSKRFQVDERNTTRYGHRKYINTEYWTLPNCSGVITPTYKEKRWIDKLLRKWFSDYRWCRLALELAGRKPEDGNNRWWYGYGLYERRQDISAKSRNRWQTHVGACRKSYRKLKILKVHGSVIGTLGNFNAIHRQAKSKKTFNVSTIVAATVKNSTVLRYGRALRQAWKVLYVDTEQSPYHCLKVMKRIYGWLACRVQDSETAISRFEGKCRLNSVSGLSDRLSIMRPTLVLYPWTASVTWYMTSTAGSESTHHIKLVRGQDDRQIHIIHFIRTGDEMRRAYRHGLNNKAKPYCWWKDRKNSSYKRCFALPKRGFRAFAFRINDNNALPELIEVTKRSKAGRAEESSALTGISRTAFRIALEAVSGWREYGYRNWKML